MPEKGSDFVRVRRAALLRLVELAEDQFNQGYSSESVRAAVRLARRALDG